MNFILRMIYFDVWDVISVKFILPEKAHKRFLDWKQRDQQAFFLLHCMISYSQADWLGSIQNLKNLQQLWNAILRNNTDIVRKTSYLRLLNDPSRIPWSPNEDLTHFYNRLDYIIHVIHLVTAKCDSIT
jgi:hypothetical protein